MDAEHDGRRLRAARVLAALDRSELAKRIDIAGLGEKTLGAIERGEREIKPHEARVLADALGVAPQFFEVDFRTLGEDAKDDPADPSARISDHDARMVDLADRYERQRHEERQALDKRLASIEDRQEEIGGALGTALDSVLEELSQQRRELRAIQRALPQGDAHDQSPRQLPAETRGRARGSRSQS